MNTLRLSHFGYFLVLAISLAFSGCKVQPENTGSPDGVPPIPNRTTQTDDESSAEDVDGDSDGGSIIGDGSNDTGGESGLYDIRGPANITVSPSAMDFQIQSLNSLNYGTFTLTNNGTSARTKPATNLSAIGLSGAYSFRQGAYPGFRGTCTDVLAPGSSCTIVIVYTPDSLSNFPLNTFGLVFNDGVESANIPIPLDGGATDIATLHFNNQIDDNPSFDFGTLAFGISITKTIRVQYWGAKPATGVTFSGLSAPFSIVSTNCGEEVSADCDVVIGYTGSNVGSFEQRLKVTYHNSSYAAEDNHTLAVITATQVIPTVLSISDGGSNSFGEVLPASTKERIFNVTRSGTMPATDVAPLAFQNPEFSFKGGSYPGLGGSCGSTIIANCFVVVTFNPSTAGNYSDTIKLNYSDGGTNKQVSQAITGQARLPALLSVTPGSTFNFGSSPLNSPVDQSFTLTNRGLSKTAASIILTGITTGEYTMIGGCGSSLAAGGSCTFTIRFNPSTLGSLGDTLQVSYFNGVTTDNSLVLNFSGQGTNGASLVASPQSHNFGSVIMGSNATKLFSIDHFGGRNASNITFSGISAPFAFIRGTYPGGGTCSVSISSTCTIRFVFSPTSGGNFSNTVVMNYDNGEGQNLSTTIQLNGTGIAVQRAVLSFSPISHNFGDVILGTQRSVTLNINRTGNLNASAINISGPSSPFSITGNSCGSTLNTNSSGCAITIRFSPVSTGATGLRQITLSYFDGIANQQTSAVVSGAGIDIAVVSVNGINFGTLPIGQNSDRTLTYVNSGSRAATSFVIDTGSITSPFSVISNSCGASLNSVSSCTVGVRFTSATDSSASDALIANFNSGGSVTSVSAALTASGTISITISSSLLNFGEVPIQSVVDLPLTITNSGTRTATAFALNSSSLTAPYSVVSTTCGSTLAGGASCSALIRFAPTTPGIFNEQLTGSYHTGLATANFSSSITGTGIISIDINSPSAIFGSLPMEQTRELDLLFLNSGTRTATSFTVNSSSIAAPFTLVSTTCGASLAGGASCAATIRFSPTVPGSFSDTLTGTYETGNGPANLSASLSGSGTLSITINTPQADFGSIPMESSSDMTLTFSNSGTRTATAFSINNPSLGAPYSVVSTDCGSTLAGGSSCNVVVRFAPTAPSSFSDSLTGSYHTGISTVNFSAPVTGTGTLSISISATNINFGSVLFGSVQERLTTITNTGTRTATAFSINNGSLAAPFSVVSTTCGATLAGGASCSALVRMVPASSGSLGDTLAGSFHTGVSTQNFSSSISGVSTISITINTNNVSFGTLLMDQTQNRTITISNSGQRTATTFLVDGSSLAAPYSVVSNSCGATLPGGSSCAVIVQFAPVTPGSKNDTLTGSYFDGENNIGFSSSLSGASITSITISSPSASFGVVPMGQSADRTLTFTNSGLRSAASFTIDPSSIPPHFSVVSSTCTGSLNAGASCSVTVRFTPTAPGNFNRSLSGSYHTGANTENFAGSLNGSSTISQLLAVNGNHSCVRNIYGQLKCWGHNNYGQLGLGDTTNRGMAPGSAGMGNNLPTVDLGQDRYPIYIALGYWHSCVILDNDDVKCWGSNSYGQLGLGIAESRVGDASNEMGNNLSTVDLGNGFTPVVLTAGYSHTCALSDQGVVKCWGQNSEGQLGIGDSTDRGAASQDMGANLPAVDLSGFRTLQISSNASHNCVLLDNQSIRCWGNNFFGQLGYGDINNRGDGPSQMGNALVAVDLGTGEIPVAVATGGAFTCAQMTTGKVKCWGRNQNGILGVNWCQDSDAYPGLCSDSNFQISLRGYGIDDHQMGDPMPYIDLGTDYQVKSLSTSNSSICAVMIDDSVKCWGGNQYGQLGLEDSTDRGLADGSMGDSLPSVDLGSGLTPVTLTSGNFHNCALMSNDEVKCWGHNLFGQLGVEDISNRGDQANQMGDNLQSVSY